MCENGVPDGLMGLDIGPKTIESFKFIMARANTIVWTVPWGEFETPPLDKGTMAIAQGLAKATARGAVTIIGDGDSAAAVEAAGLGVCPSNPLRPLRMVFTCSKSLGFQRAKVPFPEGDTHYSDRLLAITLSFRTLIAIAAERLPIWQDVTRETCVLTIR